MTIQIKLNKDQGELAQLSWGLHAVGGLLCVAIVFGIYFCIFAKIGEQDHRIQGEAESLQVFLSQQSDLKTSNKEIKHQLEERKGRLEELLRRIPNSAQESNFLAQLTKLAQEMKVTVREYNPGSVITLGDYSMLEVDVLAHANYEGLCGLLNGLSSLPRLCQIAELRVQTSETPDGNFPVRMKIRVFFVPESNNHVAINGATR